MNALTTRQLSQSHRFFLRHCFSAAASPSSVAFPSPSPSPSHIQRGSDEESRAVRVSVWWDFENCSLPSDVNVFKVAHCITSALRVSGIKGPVQITAFGDIFQLARSNQEALSATGITLTHVPSGEKNSVDRSLLLDLMYWVSHNPPPAHLFLITGDRDFAGILHRLRMSNYNILLACPDDSTSNALCSAASIMWQWSPLVKGESFACKHFNQPPDGPYNSWYGQYKGVIQDPFAVAASKLPASSDTDDIFDSGGVSDSEAVNEQQLQPVPCNVLKKLSTIVNSHPKGVLMTLLRHQMLSSAVRMDKSFYGHKSFFQFLLSMPNLVRIKRFKGHYIVFPASSEDLELVESGADVETLDASVSVKQKVEPKSHDTEKVESISDFENPNLAAPSVSKASIESVTGTLNEKIPMSSSCKVDDMQEKSDTISEKKEIYAEGKEVTIASSKNRDYEDEMGYFQKLWTKWFKKNDIGSQENTDGTSVRFQGLAPEPDSPRSADDRVTMDAKVDNTALAHGDKSERSFGFVTKLLGWFKLPKKDTDGNISNLFIEKSKKVESKRDELFLMDSFWSDIESFLNTYKGSKIVWNSKTREEIAENLRKEGPSVIQPLAEKDLLHLIDLLISEKKWIEELPLAPCPFRVVSLDGRLSPFFTALSSQSEKRPEEQGKSKAPLVMTAEPCSKTKDEVLADCKNLMDEMFASSPQAVNIAQFKSKFFEKYEYEVDYQKLGYPSLASFLQTLPGLRVGLNYVYPTIDKPENSPWEDLGPVKPRKQEGGQDKYETPLSEDDASESDSEDGKKRGFKEESSLLKILDSWHEDVNVKRDGFRKPYDFDGKTKAGKTYSFVGEDDDGSKDRLIDGILTNLKKSGKQRITN